MIRQPRSSYRLAPIPARSFSSDFRPPAPTWQFRQRGRTLLQMFNGTTLVDSVQISEPGNTRPRSACFRLARVCTLTQGPLPGSLSVPLVYNLGAGETLSLNGNQLYGDAVILADSNVGDLDTEAVNVTRTVTFSDMHVATDSLHFFGGTLVSLASAILAAMSSRPATRYSTTT